MVIFPSYLGIIGNIARAFRERKRRFIFARNRERKFARQNYRAFDGVRTRRISERSSKLVFFVIGARKRAAIYGDRRRVIRSSAYGKLVTGGNGVKRQHVRHSVYRFAHPFDSRAVAFRNVHGSRICGRSQIRKLDGSSRNNIIFRLRFTVIRRGNGYCSALRASRSHLEPVHR